MAMRSLLVVTLKKAGDPELRWSGPPDWRRAASTTRTGQASGTAGSKEASAVEALNCGWWLIALYITSVLDLQGLNALSYAAVIGSLPVGSYHRRWRY